MLYRSNILALVGGGKFPKYYLSKVMLWDDHQVKNIGEMSFRSEVKAVKLRSNRYFFLFFPKNQILLRIVVVLDAKIFMYDFADLKLNDHIETCSNPKGYISNIYKKIMGLHKNKKDFAA